MRGERIVQERAGRRRGQSSGRWRLGRGAAVLAAVAVFGGAPDPAGARVVGVTIPVRGMTCALCTKSVEESVKGLGGVRVAADLSRGNVTVETLDGRSLGLREVRDRILSAGFKIGGESEVKAIGRFILAHDSRVSFRVNGGSTYQVLENDALRRAFRRSPRLPGDYEVTFRLHDHAEWRPAGIALVRVEERRPPSPGPDPAATPAPAAGGAPAASTTPSAPAGSVP
jgi:copper chaperone CopZ